MKSGREIVWEEGKENAMFRNNFKNIFSFAAMVVALTACNDPAPLDKEEGGSGGSSEGGSGGSGGSTGVDQDGREANCFDGVDNDNDGHTDKADQDCSGRVCEDGKQSVCSCLGVPTMVVAICEDNAWPDCNDVCTSAGADGVAPDDGHEMMCFDGTPVAMNQPCGNGGMMFGTCRDGEVVTTSPICIGSRNVCQEGMIVACPLEDGSLGLGECMADGTIGNCERMPCMEGQMYACTQSNDMPGFAVCEDSVVQAECNELGSDSGQCSPGGFYACHCGLQRGMNICNVDGTITPENCVCEDAPVDDCPSSHEEGCATFCNGGSIPASCNFETECNCSDECTVSPAVLCEEVCSGQETPPECDFDLPTRSQCGCDTSTCDDTTPTTEDMLCGCYDPKPVCMSGDWECGCPNNTGGTDNMVTYRTYTRNRARIPAVELNLCFDPVDTDPAHCESGWRLCDRQLNATSAQCTIFGQAGAVRTNTSYYLDQSDVVGGIPVNGTANYWLAELGSNQLTADIEIIKNDDAPILQPAGTNGIVDSILYGNGKSAAFVMDDVW